MEVSVIGAGQMGTGISSVLATSDIVKKVNVLTRDIIRKNLILKKLEREIKRYHRHKKLACDPYELINKIEVVCELDTLQTADIVIEAITEDKEEKKKLYHEIGEFVSQKTKVFSNTSSISITELSRCFKTPSNFLGLHFFNPVTRLPIVEIVTHTESSEETTRIAEDLVKQMSMEKINVFDSPGFVVNRLLIPMINSASTLLDQSIATAGDIDKIMNVAAKHPLGPLSLADLIGLDVVVAILESLIVNDPEYNAPISKSLRCLVEAGHLGRKTNRGYFDYS